MVKVIITSSSAGNLIACVQAVLEYEPDLDPSDIIIVDDGAMDAAQPVLPKITWLEGVKPFIYARNVNIGLRAAASNDVVLLNDDALLETPGGLTALRRETLKHPGTGICSAGIKGVVGNPRQRLQRSGAGHHFRKETDTLAFVCVCIPHSTVSRLGLLDERFDGYGFDDNDYCRRAKHAGLTLAIWDGCIVNHGDLPSTFRMLPNITAISRHNRELFDIKWNRGPRKKPAAAPADQTTNARVDCMFIAWNRLEFTKASFTTLLQSTEWHLVHELFVYDDGSTDGTRQWLADAVARIEVKKRFCTAKFGSPVTAMADFIGKAQAPILAKLDNDAIYPPRWLSVALTVMDAHPELQMLGLEAMYPHDPDPDVPRTYTAARFISGLGLYRKSCFRESKPVQYNKYFGLEEWQTARGPSFITGWITPALPVFLLDRLPIMPWTRLSDEYIRNRWQRSWPKYDASSTLWRWWTPPGTTAEADERRVRTVSPDLPENDASSDTDGTPVVGVEEPSPVSFTIVIPSASAVNCIECVTSILRNEPGLKPERIMIVDDGARDGAFEALPGVTWIGGEKPFTYTRNVNIGLRAAASNDVVLMNDDVLLETPHGLSGLCRKTLAHAEIGLCSAAIEGVVCNPNQRNTHDPSKIRKEPDMLSFICVCIPASTRERVGLLDEQFDGYGFDDNDYCKRTRALGLSLGVWDGCVVDHSRHLVSSFRSQKNHMDLFYKNRATYNAKWDGRRQPPLPSPKKNSAMLHASKTTVPSRILGAMRIKNEAAHIREALTRALQLCETVYVFDDHSTDDTPAICGSFGERVKRFPSPFSGLDESRDKNYLLQHIVKAEPDWVLWIDGDEVLERTGAVKIREAVAQFPGTGSFSLRIAYVWDSNERVRVDGIYGTFHRPSLFRLKGQNFSGLFFPATAHGGHFHCGNVPTGLHGNRRTISVRLKHYGYATQEKRMEKYHWYVTQDPDNTAEDNYRHIAGISGARFAPGPVRMTPWVE